MRKNLLALILRTIAGVVLCFSFAVPQVQGLAESTDADGSNAKAVHQLGEIGEGIKVGLISADNARSTHEAFTDSNGMSHVFNYDFSGDGIRISSHDTWMAGIIASRGGVSYPNDIGVAPGADIYSAKVARNDGSIYLSDLEDALEELIVNQNCRVIVTGIALSPTPNGQSQWTRMYDYYAYAHNVTFAVPAGNSATDISVFGDAFNGITTGGLILNDPCNEYVYARVGSDSGAGPTDDYRRKPEVVAPSQAQTMPNSSGDSSWYTWTSSGGATSFSVPHTGGVAALLLGLADETANTSDNRNEVIKAVIINSAFPNIHERNNSPTTNQTYNDQRGYGRIDALHAYQILDANQVFPNQDITQEKGWAYETIGNHGGDSYKISGLKNHKLVLTVTWNRLITKSFSTYYEESSPKFNLDLVITTDPCELPLFSEDDALNNLEKVEIILPSDDIYTVTLSNTTSKSRGYALAFELIAPIVGDFSPIDYIVDYSDLAVLAGEWLTAGTELNAELTNDDFIDMFDFAEFANHWLEINPAYHQ